MTYIYNLETHHSTNVTCHIGSVDIMPDVLVGHLSTMNENADKYYVFSSDELEWWACWAIRESLISQAYCESDIKTQEQCDNLVSWYGHDMTDLQAKLCDLLNIDYDLPYNKPYKIACKSMHDIYVMTYDYAMDLCIKLQCEGESPQLYKWGFVCDFCETD